MQKASQVIQKLNEALGLEGVTKLAEIVGLSVTPTGAVIGGLGSVRTLMDLLGMGLLAERSYFLPKQFNKALENFPDLEQFLNKEVQRYTFVTNLHREVEESQGILVQQSSDKRKASFIFFGELNEVKDIIKISDFPSPEVEEQTSKLVSGDFPKDEIIKFWSA